MESKIQELIDVIRGGAEEVEVPVVERGESVEFLPIENDMGFQVIGDVLYIYRAWNSAEQFEIAKFKLTDSAAVEFTKKGDVEGFKMYKSIAGGSKKEKSSGDSGFLNWLIDTIFGKIGNKAKDAYAKSVKFAEEDLRTERHNWRDVWMTGKNYALVFHKRGTRWVSVLYTKDKGTNKWLEVLYKEMYPGTVFDYVKSSKLLVSHKSYQDYAKAVPRKYQAAGNHKNFWYITLDCDYLIMRRSIYEITDKDMRLHIHAGDTIKVTSAGLEVSQIKEDVGRNPDWKVYDKFELNQLYDDLLKSFSDRCIIPLTANHAEIDDAITDGGMFGFMNRVSEDGWEFEAFDGINDQRNLIWMVADNHTFTYMADPFPFLISDFPAMRIDNYDGRRTMFTELFGGTKISYVKTKSDGAKRVDGKNLGLNVGGLLVDSGAQNQIAEQDYQKPEYIVRDVPREGYVETTGESDMPVPSRNISMNVGGLRDFEYIHRLAESAGGYRFLENWNHKLLRDLVQDLKKKTGAKIRLTKKKGGRKNKKQLVDDIIRVIQNLK